MKKLKKSKLVYNEKFFDNDKCYLVFTFLNVDSSVIELLKLTIEEEFGLKIFKTNEKANSIDIFLQLDIKYFVQNKNDLNDYFFNENFKFFLTSVYYKNNYFHPEFFENELLYEVDEYEITDELLHCVHLNLLSSFIEKKKIIFLLYGIIFSAKNIFIYNVNNPSSSI